LHICFHCLLFVDTRRGIWCVQKASLQQSPDVSWNTGG